MVTVLVHLRDHSERILTLPRIIEAPRFKSHDCLDCQQVTHGDGGDYIMETGIDLAVEL